jgi:hypothetical protein
MNDALQKNMVQIFLDMQKCMKSIMMIAGGNDAVVNPYTKAKQVLVRVIWDLSKATIPINGEEHTAPAPLPASGAVS